MTRAKPRSTRGTGTMLTAALVVLLISGCAEDRRIDIAAKRENLDLAYLKQELAKKPPTLAEIVEGAPAIPGLPSNAAAIATPSGSRRNNFNPPPSRTCRVAAPDTPASSQTTTSANGAPRLGVYPAHQTGTFAFRAGSYNVSGPVARESYLQIQRIVDTSTVDGSGRTQPNITFEEVVPGLGVPTITTYRITAAQLQLIKIVTGDDTFQPASPVTIMQFRDTVGSNWTSAGVDVDTTEAMTVQGTIQARDRVDLCGTVIEAYRVSSQERRVNSQTGYSYETDAAQPKLYYIATQAGALFVKIREKSTTNFVVDGTAATAMVDYTRTLDAATPNAP